MEKKKTFPVVPIILLIILGLLVGITLISLVLVPLALSRVLKEFITKVGADPDELEEAITNLSEEKVATLFTQLQGPAEREDSEEAATLIIDALELETIDRDAAIKLLASHIEPQTLKDAVNRSEERRDKLSTTLPWVKMIAVRLIRKSQDKNCCATS